MFPGRSKYLRTCVIIDNQFPTGVIFLDSLESITPKSKNHTPFHLHCCRPAYLLQIAKTVFPCQIVKERIEGGANEKAALIFR